MSIVVVGGHSRNVGKTSVVAGLIAALPDRRWTAVKITQFGHGVCSVTAEPCACALNEREHSWSLDEELDRGGGSDTARFLVAGAARVFWVRTKQGMLAEAMPALREVMANAGNVILESNSVMRFLRPDLYLTVLDPATEDFKDSAREFLDRADALVVHAPAAAGTNLWKNISLKPVGDKPVFQIAAPPYVTAELVKFVASRI